MGIYMKDFKGLKDATPSQEFEGSFKYQTSWQHTYLAAARLVEPKKQVSHAPLKVQGFYSDLLYQPWFCATTPIREEWLQRDNLERRSGLSIADFRQHFELPNRPVVLSDAVSTPSCCTSGNGAVLNRAANVMLVSDAAEFCGRWTCPI